MAKESDPLQPYLKKLKKDELIEIILELSGDYRTIQRNLESRLNVQTPDSKLVETTKQAIADATYFDEREINRNFDFDYEAYALVAKNFDLLRQQARWADLRSLSIDLMNRASYQLEMSDEGMMLDEIEECFKPVVRAIPQSGLSREDQRDWVKSLLAADRVCIVLRSQLIGLDEKLKQ